MRSTTSVLVSCLCSVLVGCATSSTLSTGMETTAPARSDGDPPMAAGLEPDPDMATIVFMKPSNRVLAGGIIDSSGAVLGDIPGQSIVVTKVKPGPHAFVKVLFKDALHGDYRIFGHLVCNQLTGNFTAGRFYFIEASIFRLFLTKADHPKLAAWAAGQRVQMTGARTVNSDPEWAPCLAQAAENSRKEAEKGDLRSTASPNDGLAAWPR